MTVEWNQEPGSGAPGAGSGDPGIEKIVERPPQLPPRKPRIDPDTKTDINTDAESTRAKRPVSPEKAAANRRNARLSTGARSPETKAVTRLNGVTHAMT